jgi:hypothetical protein
LEQISDGRVTPNIVDIQLAILLEKPRDKTTKRILQQNRELLELSDLLDEALKGDEDIRTNATSAVLALRGVVAAEERGDREDVIKLSSVILTQIDSAKYPLTWAQTHLKLGTTLAVQSQSGSGVKIDILRRSVESLNQALTVFGEKESPELACLAHYNLALAHDALWQGQDDWDDQEDGDKKAALRHGTAAIGLMNAGATSGNRLSLTKTLLKIALADGEIALRQSETRFFVIDLLDGFLRSPDAKTLEASERKWMRELLTQVRKRS